LNARLSDATLAVARPSIVRPAYDRASTTVGVVHFGPGAFHRAHQAFYFDELLGRDPTCAVSAVSLRSPGVRNALAPQGGLYTLAELDEATSFRVIGAIREVLVAPETPEAVFARLADPRVRTVTITVTEKGYTLEGGGDLDARHPDIEHDLRTPQTPVSLVGWLLEGLRRRRATGAPPFDVVSCDNLVDNGARLRRAVVQFAETSDRELARWIEREVRFPRTMVDSITPATDDALRRRVEVEVGLVDAWPIQREAFTQWVVEDALQPGAPDLRSVGVTLSNDVPAYDRAKLRLLNGAHSTLAYLGLLRGHETVAEAMADSELARLVESMMREDIAPTISAPPELDLQSYLAAVLRRFRNPTIRHLLSQIAWDGSQKLPFRILGTAADALAAGAPLSRLALPLAAWMVFVRNRAREGADIVDPLAPRLLELGRACTGDAGHDVQLFLQLETVFPRTLAGDARLRSAVEVAYARLPQIG
jgi:fructuronate reductase